MPSLIDVIHAGMTCAAEPKPHHFVRRGDPYSQDL